MRRWLVASFGVAAVCGLLWFGQDRKTCVSRGGHRYVVGATTPCNHAKLLDVMYRCQRVVLEGGDGPCVRRIRRRWDGSIHELVDGGRAPAVTHGKKTVQVCLDGDPSTESLVFVVLHELAHVGCASVGHTPEFWTAFSTLLETAGRIGVYTEHDPTERVCGTEVGPGPPRVISTEIK